MRRKVTIIFAASLPAAVAAKAATTTIPIVFVMGADPVQLGVVSSLNQPGGNLTGVTQFYGTLGGKRLELLRELVPAASIIGVLTHPVPNSTDHLTDVQTAATAMGLRVLVFSVSVDADIAQAFVRLSNQGAQALLVADDPDTDAINLRHRPPATPSLQSTIRANFPRLVGLISYGSNAIDNYRLGGMYIARILKGTSPADLPILQPTKFELVINLKTAKTLGLTYLRSCWRTADEVIE